MKFIQLLKEIVQNNYDLSNSSVNLTLDYFKSKQLEFWHDIFLIKNEVGNSFVLKLFRSERMMSELEFEVQILNYCSNFISVPKIIKTNRGKEICKLTDYNKTRYFIVYEYFKGSQLGNEIDSFYRSGKIISLLHTHKFSDFFEGQGKVYDRYLDIISLSKIATSVFVKFNFDANFIKPFTEHFCTEIDSLDERTDAGIIHGDIHNSNILTNEHDICLLDFDMSGYSWKLYDLGVFYFFLTWYPPYRYVPDKCWAAFLEGYSVNKSISKKDIQHIEIFMLARFFRLFEYKDIASSRELTKYHYMFLFNWIKNYKTKWSLSF